MKISFMRNVIGYLYLWLDGERYFLLRAKAEVLGRIPRIAAMYEALDCGHIQAIASGWNGGVVGFAAKRKCKQCVNAQPIYLSPKHLADLPAPPPELRRIA